MYVRLGQPASVNAIVSVQPGGQVEQGDRLLAFEAMKMETAIHAEHDTTVKAVNVTPGSQIDAKDLVVEME